MAMHPGLEASVRLVVGDGDTAAALGSGDVAVLGTPRIVGLCEQAAVEAIAGSLEPGQTSVGTRIDLAHVAPTTVGRRVVARARLDSVDGRTLGFSFEVSDDTGPVASGTHTRVLVDRDRFLRDASER